MSVWTHQKRVAVYRKLTEHFGPYNFYTYHGRNLCANPDGKLLACAMYPAGWSISDGQERLRAIHDDLEQDGVFGERIPSRKGGIEQQLAHCMTTQPLTPNNSGNNTNQHYRRCTIAKNRLAAYEAGFITMRDIVKLEEIAEDRVRVGVINSNQRRI